MPSLKLLSRHVALKGVIFTSLFTKLAISKRIELTYTQIATISGSPNLWIFEATRAHMKRTLP